MPRKSALKCYFGCATEGTLHKFPVPHYPYLEMFNEWKSILCENVLNKGDTYIYNNIRICNEHFETRYITSGGRLTRTAVPTLNTVLTSSVMPLVRMSTPEIQPAEAIDTIVNPKLQKDQDVEEECVQQDVAILCNNCQNVILGFRYKCVTCDDYDLCKKCEMMEIHSEHYMLRIPKPLEYKEAADIGQKLKQIFIPDSEVLLIKEEDPIGDTTEVCTVVETTQDDNVSGDIHLSERFKNIIQSEVSRVLDECNETRETHSILQRKKTRKRIVERGKLGDEKRRCYVNTKVNAAPEEVVFVDTSSGFDTQESSVEVKQEMCDESELIELDVDEIINPYGTENNL